MKTAIARIALAGSVLGIASHGGAAAGEEPAIRVIDKATPYVRPANVPAASDVTMRSLKFRPMGESDPHDTFRALDAFHATQMAMSCSDPNVNTPNLDRLAASGFRSTRTYTTSPVCCPARASIQTGYYPHNAGFPDYGNGQLSGYDTRRARTRNMLGAALCILLGCSCPLAATHAHKPTATRIAMNRGDRLKVGVAVAAAIWGTGASAESGAAERPNIILILTDDQGYNDLGCFGSDRIKTPNIDRMAAEGMRFTDFYATSPICTPTRASIMTGCYPSRVGLGTPLHVPDTIGLHENEITLPELLKSRGYATACIGKWHLGHHPKFYPTCHGFDDYYGTPLGHCFLTEQMRKKGEFSDLFLRNEERVPFPPIEELTEALTADAVQWIKANKDNPFFLFMSHPMPHGPVAASDRFRGKSAGGLYGDAVETIDWSTGEIIKTLNELGLQQDTIVVFTSDNGADENAWGTKATWFGSNAPFRGKKQQAWEGGLRVPCVMWAPGRIPAGTTCDEIATVMDFLPTFSAMAGADVPTDRVIDGKDIRDLMAGQPGATSPYDAFIFHARLGKRSGIRIGDWKLLVETDAVTWKHRGDALYYLKSDPGETRNCAAEYPDKVSQLRARLKAFEKELSQTARTAGCFDASAERQ